MHGYILRGVYIFSRQMTPTSSQYHIHPLWIVMPWGSGSESASCIFSSISPVSGSCLKNAFRLESVTQRYLPSHPMPCGRLPAVPNLVCTTQVFGSIQNTVRAGGAANHSFPSLHS